jgi:HPt (histidine-containing phosphotransfer) domain-containing protein
MSLPSAQHEILDSNLFDDYKELLDNKFSEGLRRFLVDLDDLMGKVQSGFEQGDTGVIHEAVHCLKSSSALVGALPLSKLSHKTETQIKCGVSPSQNDIDTLNTAAADLRNRLWEELQNAG